MQKTLKEIIMAGKRDVSGHCYFTIRYIPECSCNNHFQEEAGS